MFFFLGMTVVGYRPETMHIALNRYIPPAAVLGGFAVGGLTIFSDFMGALGSGIIYFFYEFFLFWNTSCSPPPFFFFKLY
jgi:preprotein translocase subunit SecY